MFHVCKCRLEFGRKVRLELSCLSYPRSNPSKYFDDINALNAEQLGCDRSRDVMFSGKLQRLSDL